MAIVPVVLVVVLLVAVVVVVPFARLGVCAMCCARLRAVVGGLCPFVRGLCAVCELTKRRTSAKWPKSYTSKCPTQYYNSYIHKSANDI